MRLYLLFVVSRRRQTGDPLRPRRRIARRERICEDDVPRPVSGHPLGGCVARARVRPSGRAGDCSGRVLGGCSYVKHDPSGESDCTLCARCCRVRPANGRCPLHLSKGSRAFHIARVGGKVRPPVKLCRERKSVVSHGLPERTLAFAVGSRLAPFVSMMLIDKLDARDATYGGAANPRNAASDMSTMTRRIQSEYEEMPGLVLTEAQARRLWNLDARTCRLALTALLERRFLKRTATGMYVRAS